MKSILWLALPVAVGQQIFYLFDRYRLQTHKYAAAVSCVEHLFLLQLQVEVVTGTGVTVSSSMPWEKNFGG